MGAGDIALLIVSAAVFGYLCYALFRAEEL